jgi:tRNA(fMet)-specific endonuclease VapC
MGLILDSSILIAAERGRFDLPALFQSRPDEAFFIAAITASELLHGVQRADTPERRGTTLQPSRGHPAKTPRH